MNDRLVSTSKFMSLILRHKPETIGLTLDANGWADIDELLRLAKARGKALDRKVIEQVVADNDKQRFIISEDGSRIRANQGHSISIDLALTPREPPSVLFHGTATRFLDSIREQGLLHGNRQHVHLSLEQATAVNVGRRHGKPVILEVAAKRMHEEGHIFFLSENGVWLTEHVPTLFIRFPGG
jgi:putative RNA 2'-phosphotransferase